MGIPFASPILRFIFGDKTYLNNQMPNRDCSYYNYRDSSVENFVFVVEA